MKLGIYIPTYNRPKEVSAQLKSLLPQLTPEVFVRVQDNGSTTYQLDDLQRDFVHPQVEFFRNACNIGANANIAMGFPLMGYHDYLWILSDNDILVSDAVQSVLAQLVDSPDLVVFGKPVGDISVWEDMGQGWNASCPGLISEGIYKTKCFLPYAQNAFFYHNTSFPHLAVYYATKQKERIQVCYRERKLFVDQGLMGGAKGNYSLSVAGMPQICALFSAKERPGFLRSWLRDLSGTFFSPHTDELRFVAAATTLLLVRYIPLTFLFYWVRFQWQAAKKKVKLLIVGPQTGR